MGIKFGKPVLVENIGSKLDLVLHPICNKEYISKGNTKSVSLPGRMVKVD